MKKLLLLLPVLILLGAGCETGGSSTQSVPKAQRVLEEQGYTNVRLDGAPFFGCGKDDSLWNSFNFSAETPIKTHVNGYVCCGWFKGCTVRYS